MKNGIRSVLMVLAFMLPAAQAAENPVVRLTTSHGAIEIELYPDRAPATVENFLGYVKSGFYKGTIFHRVIPGFMIQGGGFTSAMQEKAARAPIKNEATNGLKNEAGTIAMARTMDPHSAAAQFFINTVDNVFLDHREQTMRGWGYTVFGKVTKGMEVVKRIEQAPTGNRGPHQNVPVKDIVIESAEIVKPASAPKPADGKSGQK